MLNDLLDQKSVGKKITSNFSHLKWNQKSTVWTLLVWVTQQQLKALLSTHLIVVLLLHRACWLTNLISLTQSDTGLWIMHKGALSAKWGGTMFYLKWEQSTPPLWHGRSEGKPDTVVCWCTPVIVKWWMQEEHTSLCVDDTAPGRWPWLQRSFTQK